MRIRRLKLSGFKSFVEPAELRVEAGLTGVVGPNGCGKSNLLEAIRWVMGEASAKSLRGGGMEDVIFAGTATRPARDFAEVVLLADDGDGAELEVVRRIERGAGSAYRVNGRDVRARDVALIFADAATGAHSPALVSQGRIAAVIAAKPAERRAMLEEAAGIAGLHVRRREAELRLRATEVNLARLDDLMAALEGQAAGLRRQARAAERYTALSGQIRLAEARLVFARWQAAAHAADAAKAEAEQADGLVATRQAEAKAAQQAQASAAAVLAQARDAVADRRDDTQAHGHRMATLAGQLEAAEQRLVDFGRQIARLTADRGEADQITASAAEALATLERQTGEARASLAEAEARRPALAEALDNATRAATAAELTLAQARAAQAGVEAEWRIAEAEVAASAARAARADADIERHETQRQGLPAPDEAEAEVAAAVARAEGATAALAEARGALAANAACKAGAQGQRDAGASALAAARADLAGLEREHQALARDADARATAARGGHGLPLAIDRVRAAPGYERALAAVLGGGARAPLGRLADGRFWAGAAPLLPVADSLSAHVRDCPAELAARLALVHVAEDDDARALTPGEWLVTIGGRLRRWDGYVTTGEGAAEAAVLESANRRVELDRELPPRRDAVAAGERRLAEASLTLTEAQAAQTAAEQTLAQAAEAERAALRARDMAEDARDRLALRRAEIAAAAGDLAVRRDEAQREHAAAEARRATLAPPDAGRAGLAEAQDRHNAARLALQGAAAALAAQDQSLAALRERHVGQVADIRGWQARAGDAARRLAETVRRLEEIAGERAVTAARPEALAQEIDEGAGISARVSAALAEAEAGLSSAASTARTGDAMLAATQEALAQAREARAGAAARADNEAHRRAEMGRISGERFQCPPVMLPDRLGFAAADIGETAAESAELERLTADRERLGPVNLVAAEELAEAETRAAEALRERGELAEAVNRLRGAIGHLNREGRERLRAAFAAVDTHFRRLFARLFASSSGENGEAHLALIDSDDPLEAGLEIFAQPPGKRLQSLTLLSGGEQALTAVALIFALFLTNPAPICVLDEVDAPLDDANIERFCDLLDAMVAQTATRYLIVTHNAVTMSRMHRLFGVTMVEQGVSRLVSVDLGAAEALLAAE